MRNLNNKRVLITGGAQGIGREMALLFADEGAQILLCDINAEKLEKTQQEITAQEGNCHAYVLDVTKYEDILKVREQIHQDSGPIDVLVNNAGVVFGGAFLGVPYEKHVTTYRVNVEGPMALTHAFLPDLIARTDAHIVNIASAAGLIGLPFGATYAASKWAMVGFSESMRLELKKLGHTQVKVTTVCPSYIGTGMFNGVEVPRLTQMLDPHQLAQKVLDGMKKDKVFVMEPWLVKVTPLLRGVLPLSLVDKVSDLFGATSGMTQWRGHGKK
jgi:short-subunit dehydrogenase